MSKIKAVTYKESLIAFFEQQLAHANRQLDWAVKHNPDCYVCAEKGEIVSFYQDAIAALLEKQARESGCDWCADNYDHRHKTMFRKGSDWNYEAKYCDMCGKRLEDKP